MILNDFKRDIKVKCAETGMTQAKIGEAIGKPQQHVNKLATGNIGVISKLFVNVMDAMGYDVLVTYVKKQ